MVDHRMAIPSIKFPGTHFYTWVNRATASLAQERKTMFSGRARTRTARSGVELNNDNPLRLPIGKLDEKL